MRYELECGHCGYQFVLDAVVLPRTMKCDVCGGVLAIAVPVPVAPPVLPKPAPPVSVPVPPAVDVPPRPRAKPLAEPWPSVRAAFGWGKVAVGFAAALLVAVVVANLVGPRPSSDDPWAAARLPACAVLLPVLLHTACQIQCAGVPPAYGRGLANASVLVLPLAVGGCVLGWGSDESRAVFAAVGAAGALFSLGLWLAFLARLGERLGDGTLTTAARAYSAWLAFGLVQAVTLLVAAYLAEGAGGAPLGRLGRAGAGVILLFLLWKYSAVLRAAVRAIDRRAPVEPGG